MRFKTNFRKYCDQERVRTKQYFSILPTNVNGEIRWLEFVKVKQIFTELKGGFVGYSYKWINYEFIDD